jgi:hypothetical protein
MAAAALPDEVLACIYALLMPPEVAAAACVCRAWRAAAANPAMWRDAFVRLFGAHAAAALLHCSGVAPPNWRGAVADRYRASVGWRDAKCRAYKLEGANQDAEVFKIVDGYLLACNADGGCAHASAARCAAAAADATDAAQARCTFARWSGARAASGGPPSCVRTRPP